MLSFTKGCLNLMASWLKPIASWWGIFKLVRSIASSRALLPLSRSLGYNMVFHNLKGESDHSPPQKRKDFFLDTAGKQFDDFLQLLHSRLFPFLCSLFIGGGFRLCLSLGLRLGTFTVNLEFCGYRVQSFPQSLFACGWGNSATARRPGSGSGDITACRAQWMRTGCTMLFKIGCDKVVASLYTPYVSAICVYIWELLQIDWTLQSLDMTPLNILSKALVLLCFLYTRYSLKRSSSSWGNLVKPVMLEKQRTWIISDTSFKKRVG